MFFVENRMKSRFIQKFIGIFLPVVAVFISLTAVYAQKSDLKIITETKKINGEELRSLVKATPDKQPVLINFWATWCGPCYSEFPELVQVDADYRKKGLNFVIVSVDNFSLIDTRVPEFLQQFDSTMPSYLIDLPNRAEIAKAIRRIAPRFTDRYPLTLLYDADGKLVFQKPGRIDAKILRAEIDKVLPKNNKTSSK